MFCAVSYTTHISVSKVDGMGGSPTLFTSMSICGDMTRYHLGSINIDDHDFRESRLRVRGTYWYIPRRVSLESGAGETLKRGWRKPASEVKYLWKAALWMSGDTAAVMRVTTEDISLVGSCIVGEREKGKSLA